ncbi:MAG: glutamine synthetase family protein [Pseudomonadota bacterium]
MSKSSFQTRHNLWTDDQRRQAADIAERIKTEGFTSLRLAFADQHGILRGKTLIAEAAADKLGEGCALTTTLLLKDTSHRTVFPVWQSGGGLEDDKLTGAADFIMLPDPATFQELPWAPGTCWMLCDIYYPDGTPVPFSTRRICQTALGTLAQQGFNFLTGLEVEFHVFHILDEKLEPADATHPGAPPEVELMAQGYQYLTETRYDELEPICEVLRSNLVAMGLPLQSMEVEFGPSQLEFTFAPQEGIATADTMMLFRSAVKQICRREGVLATFMCRPALENVFSSGWHLHQSILDAKTGANLFQASDGEVLSEMGRQFTGGLLAHAAASSVFTTPTINGYKRYQPHTLAPDRISWGRDNRGSMIRVCGQPGDAACHIENRAGEPAANPYLYLTSQILSGMDGVKQKTDPGPPSDEPYSVEADKLPGSLMEAVAALKNSSFYRSSLDDEFVDYLTTIKQAECERFLSRVTDWEQREYFQTF